MFALLERHSFNGERRQDSCALPWIGERFHIALLCH